MLRFTLTNGGPVFIQPEYVVSVYRPYDQGLKKHVEGSVITDIHGSTYEVKDDLVDQLEQRHEEAKQAQAVSAIAPYQDS